MRASAMRHFRWIPHGTRSAACSRRLPASIKDHAILLLLSVYGLRSGEVGHLRLDNIDWPRNRSRFVRPKSGRQEEAPEARVGNAIARYLHDARPKAASRAVFPRLRAPCEPLPPGGLYQRKVPVSRMPWSALPSARSRRSPSRFRERSGPTRRRPPARQRRLPPSDCDRPP